MHSGRCLTIGNPQLTGTGSFERHRMTTLLVRAVDVVLARTVHGRSRYRGQDVVIPGVGLAPAPGVAPLTCTGEDPPAQPYRSRPPAARPPPRPGIPPERRERPLLPPLSRPARPPPHPDPQPGPLRQRPRSRSSAHRADSEQRQAFDLHRRPDPAHLEEVARTITPHIANRRSPPKPAAIPPIASV